MIYAIVVLYLLGGAGFFRVVNFTGKRYDMDFFDDADEHIGVIMVALLTWPIWAIVGLCFCIISGTRIYISPPKQSGK